MVAKQWVYTGARAGGKGPSPSEKQEITAACENLINTFFIPRFLPEIQPTEFNYPIAIYDKWHGKMYRFITRYRSDRADAISPEFDAPFTRIEFVSKNHFDLSYMRHTDQWHRLFERLTLDEAVTTIKEMIHFHPCC